MPPQIILYVAVAADSVSPIFILAFQVPSSFLRASCSGPGAACPSALMPAVASMIRTEPKIEAFVFAFIMFDSRESNERSQADKGGRSQANGRGRLRASDGSTY